MRVDDAVIGVILIVFAVAEIAYAQTFPVLGGMDVGPSLFPTVIGGGLVLCGVALIVQSTVRRRRLAATPWLVRDAWARHWRSWANAGVVLLVVLGFVLAVDRLGYHLTALAALLVLLFWLRVRPLTASIVAVVTTAATHELFYSWLRVPLPWGVLEPVAW